MALGRPYPTRKAIAVRDPSLTTQAPEQVLATVLDALAVRVFWKDLDLRYLGCNRTFAEDCGLRTPDEIAGKSDFDLPCRGDAERYRLCDHQILETGQARLDFEDNRVVNDGQTLRTRMNKMALRDADGNIVGVLGFYAQAGNWASHGRGHSTSEQMLRVILDTLPYPIFAKDRDLRYTLCNPAFEQYLGKTNPEIVGKSVFDVSPAPLAQVYHQADVALMNSRGKQIYETKVRYHNGTDHDVVFYKGVFNDAQGEVAGMVGHLYDVTDRKRMEEALRQAHKMESIGRLAGGVAHDFNNLLSPILGYSDLLLRQIPSDDLRRNEVLQIRRAAIRARDLVQQLLAFGRKQILELKAVDLRQVVGDVDPLLRRTIREDVRIDIVLPDHLDAVRADIAQLEQVLLNLAINAQDAMPDGGVLTIELSEQCVDEAAAVDIRGLQPGRYVLLTVSDTGIGMSQATLDCLFEPFFTTKETGKGTGLGLSMVYGIVTQHGGHVVACSKPGHGSAFRIYLPIVDAAVEPPPLKQPPSASAPGGQETILLVEDDEMVRTMTRKMLEYLGYRVVVATFVHEAIEAVESHNIPVDLLLTDVIMPEMNGRILYDRLSASRPGLRVLYMSGYDRNVIAQLGVLVEGVHFLQKPFNEDALASKIREALSGQLAVV
jgi:PAS domain S-box-containing protein